MASQEGFSLCRRPASQYQAASRPSQQMHAGASRSRNTQRRTFTFTHDTFDNTHTMLFNLAQKYSFGYTRCQAAHGRYSKVTQTGPLHINLGKVVNPRAKHIPSISGLLNLTARRLAKEDERDLEQARVGIDAISAWGSLLPEEAAKQVAQAVDELKMLYAQLARGGGAGEGEGGPGGEQPVGPDAGTSSGKAGAPEERPAQGDEPPPRLWTPGSG